MCKVISTVKKTAAIPLSLFSCNYIFTVHTEFIKTRALGVWLKRKHKNYVRKKTTRHAISTNSLLRRLHFDELELNSYRQHSLREKCPNTEHFLVRIFLYSN